MTNNNSHAVPIARIFFREDESSHEGWYVQHYVCAELRTTRLQVRDGAERTDILTEAAGFVGCVPDQIQIEGLPWPSVQLSN